MSTQHAQQVKTRHVIHEQKSFTSMSTSTEQDCSQSSIRYENGQMSLSLMLDHKLTTSASQKIKEINEYN